MQLFSHNPRGWGRRPFRAYETEEFRKLRIEWDISPCFIHASYLINLCSPEARLWQDSIDLLLYEAEAAERLGVDGVVLHPGRGRGQPLNRAIKRAKEALRVLWQAVGEPVFVIENTAGQKGEIGASVEEMIQLLDGPGAGCVKGICIDTAHAFAAGYDIRDPQVMKEMVKRIEDSLSPLRVVLIHLNDTKSPLGGRVDRHEHIGMGQIGLSGFRRLLRELPSRDIPLVLETPRKTDDDDRRNLSLVKRLLSEGQRPP